MKASLALRISALLAALGVALGAYGAHGLGKWATPDQVEIWRTAVFYHLLHAVAGAWLGGQTPAQPGPWWSWMTGILLFSGSLYALVLSGVKVLGAITPLGGLALILGWLWLAVRPVRRP